MSRKERSFSSIGKRLGRRLLLRQLATFALLDVVLLTVLVLWLRRYLTPDGMAAVVGIAVGVELLILVLTALQNAGLIKKTLKPLNDLSAAAAQLTGKTQATRGGLTDLAGRLGTIDAAALDTRLPLDGPAELRELTQAINGLLERLDAAYAEQNRFVSDASHELRTPIAVIQGYARMLDRWGKDDPAARQEAIDAINAEASSMQALVEQLLFLARGDNRTAQVEMEQVDVTELAAQVLRETALIDQTHPLTADWTDPVVLTADPGLIKEALRILVDNAVKYTPAGGRVTLKIRREEDRCALSVTDEGPGVSPQDLPHLFDRFYRADASRARETGGSGLGLSIALWIVRRHGGHIQAKSLPGLGSRFTIYLPMEQERPAA